MLDRFPKTSSNVIESKRKVKGRQLAGEDDDEDFRCVKSRFFINVARHVSHGVDRYQ